MKTKKSPLRLLFSIIVVGGMVAASIPGFAGPVSASAAKATVSMPAAQPSFADVFERVSPAVVNISVEKKADVRQMSGFPGQMPGRRGDPSLDEFFGRFFGAPGVPLQAQPSRALGSGLIFDSEGYVVTNNHVIEGADSIVVMLEDGRELKATLIGADPKTDLALLKIKSDIPLTSVSFGDSDAARVGDWILAVGNPFGLGGSATFGIISAIGRDIQSGPYDNYLQIDAPINSGNSGGPVFNAAGEAIGINTAIFSPNGGNVGIGFAIPAAQVISVTNALKESGHVSRGWLGVQIQEIDKDLAENLGVPADGGILVADVVEDSPAEKAGIKTGDIITKFDGRTVQSPKDLSRMVAEAKPDAKVRLDILRDGKEKNVAVKLGLVDSDGALAANDQAESAAAEELGLSLMPLSDELRAQLGVDEDSEGVVVANVLPGSAASNKGLRRGDLIVAVDNKDVTRLADFDAAIADARSAGDSARLLVRRGDGQLFVAVRLS